MLGRKDEEKERRNEAWTAAVEAEVARLDALPLAELASHVMVRGFGPEVCDASDDATVDHIALRLIPNRGFAFPALAPGQLRMLDQLERLVVEGLLELHNASLVGSVATVTASRQLLYRVTRRGRAALERGEVERILDQDGR